MMSIRSCCSIAVFLCMSIIQVQSKKPPCPSNFPATHSACLAPRTGSKKPSEEGISSDKRQQIVNIHNGYRSKVDKYNGQPSATNMQKMYWDDELAMVAQKWVSNCVRGHDASANRNIPGKYSVGQNYGMGFSDWASVIARWQSEVQYLQFGRGKKPDSAVVGHYTQVVWADSSRIGCGYAKCKKRNVYVCNYARAGNIRSKKYEPYAEGRRASSCPKSAVSGLCDCHGKICLNDGKLDVNTCKCICSSGEPSIQTDGDCSRGSTKPKKTTLKPAKAVKKGKPATRPVNNATANKQEKLPQCKKAAERVKCGQPSSKGYYTTNFCKYKIIERRCPAMCGKCLVRKCVDSNGNSYLPGESWSTKYGKRTCTVNGVKNRRGCYIRKTKTILFEGEKYSYTKGKYLWTCTCRTGYLLNCRGRRA